MHGATINIFGESTRCTVQQ